MNGLAGNLGHNVPNLVVQVILNEYDCVGIRSRSMVEIIAAGMAVFSPNWDKLYVNCLRPVFIIFGLFEPKCTEG